MAEWLYCDGGVIGVNPSPYGGTAAFVVLCEDKHVTHEGVAIIRPAAIGLPAVSNNVSELVACLLGLRSLPDGWNGTIFTDSYVTRCRLVNEDPKFNGIPQELVREVWMHRERMRGLSVTLLDGHPTKKQLAAGIGKRGNPVSEWNVWCDRVCTQAGQASPDDGVPLFSFLQP